MNRDPVSNQLENYKKNNKPERITTASGKPFENAPRAALTAGERGPLVLQDLELLDELSHLSRERIPERLVHAKGAGAFGIFEVTNDVTKYCKAKIFEKIGKKTPLAIRFSSVVGSSGSADTVRDARGFAVKFYTEEGNWDIVGLNAPILFIRDPMFFTSIVHSQKKNPVTNLLDYDSFWDFLTLRPETIHQTTLLFTDRGIPYGFRHMNGFGSHAFKLVNNKNEAVYCKFHIKTDQGIKNFTVEEASKIVSKDPDWALRDLYNAIARENYPSWTLYIQVMTFEEAEKWKYNPFDLTKVWLQGEFPLIEVGKITLNRNPTNYFAQVEQIAMSPANLVPGIEPSPDKIFQARLLAYNDTHRHRLGANFFMIPVNCPFNARVRNTLRDGPMCFDNNQEGSPNYYPNSFNGLVENTTTSDCAPSHSVKGTVDVARYDTSNEDNFTQCGIFYRKVLTEEKRELLVNNIADHLINAQEFIQRRAIENFSKVDPDYGERVRAALDRLKSESGMILCPSKANL